MLRFSRHSLLKIIVVLAAVLLPASSYASYLFKATVIDSLSHEPVPFASVAVIGGTKGVLCDENGRFSLYSTSAKLTLSVSAIGFKSVEIVADSHRYSDYSCHIELFPSGVTVGEVVVRPKKEKYSKKNNPAVDLSRRIASARSEFDPRKNTYMSYDKYESYTLGFNDFSPDSTNNVMLRKFKFLNDYIDTCDITGKPYLPLSVKEAASTVYYRKDPRKEIEMVKGESNSGIDDFLDQENMRTFLETILGDVDIFANDVPLLQNRFVSPFSPIAPDFYKFYITDTVAHSGVSFTELTFVPRNSQTFGFTGKIYVNESDSGIYIDKVMLNVPKAINLNFIDRLYINQEYRRGPNNTLLKDKEEIVAEVKVMPGVQGVYARKNSVAGQYNFSAPQEEEFVFSHLGHKFSIADINDTTASTVALGTMRYTPLSQKSKRTNAMMRQLRGNNFYYWTEKVLKILFTGYISTAQVSKVDVGPMNTIISHNTIEGYRFRAGGMTTANLNPHLFGRGYVAWGSNDHIWKYSAQIDYSFSAKKYHPQEFPIHSLRLTHQYDVDMLGQHYAFANPDNMFLSFKRHKDYQITYLRKTQLKYTLELMNHFSIAVDFEHRRQEATEYMPFITTSGRAIDHYNESVLRVNLRYAPGEKFYQTKTHRRAISHDAPIISLTHEYGPKGILGNLFTINKTELSFQKRFWFSAFGYTDIIVKGGHVWSRASYPDLMIPNANLSYTIQPESYSLMNAMEFINDSYASLDFTYWANGAIFNYIPYFKKLKLREVFAFKGLIGHLSKKNDPTRHNTDQFAFPAISNTQKLGNTPYMEVSAGIDNILKFFRLDYVWRLTYRNNPGIDKHGLRVSAHLTF